VKVLARWEGTIVTRSKDERIEVKITRSDSAVERRIKRDAWRSKGGWKRGQELLRGLVITRSS
jgi:hypothetical protein